MYNIVITDPETNSIDHVLFENISWKEVVVALPACLPMRNSGTVQVIDYVSGKTEMELDNSYTPDLPEGKIVHSEAEFWMFLFKGFCDIVTDLLEDEDAEGKMAHDLAESYSLNIEGNASWKALV